MSRTSPEVHRRDVNAVMLEVRERHLGEVRERYLGAQALYRHLGYVVEGRRPGYYRGPGYYRDDEAALIMWRHGQES